MGTVTKKDLVDRIADKSGQRRTVVKTVVQEFLDELISELGKGNRLEFRDFGVFDVRTRAARTAQNPKTLEPVEVPAKRTVKFKPGRLMKAEMDKPIPAPVPAVSMQVEPKPSPAVVGQNHTTG